MVEVLFKPLAGNVINLSCGDIIEVDDEVIILKSPIGSTNVRNFAVCNCCGCKLSILDNDGTFRSFSNIIPDSNGNALFKLNGKLTTYDLPSG
jgi:hypothetical protein